MSNRIKLMTFGSSASVEFIAASDANTIELVNAYSGFTFASLAQSPKQQKPLQGLSALWQELRNRPSLRAEVLTKIKENNYDIILIDLLDECYEIRKAEQNPEDKSKSVALAFDVEAELESWKRGIDEFLRAADQIGETEKIRVCKLYWATQTESGVTFSGEKRELIERHNRLLDKMYAYLRRHLSFNQLIEYPKHVLVAADADQADAQPYQYSSAVHLHTQKRITAKLFVQSPESAQKLAAGRVFEDFVSAFRTVRKGEFFLFKNGVMYPIKWDMSAGLHSPVVFFTPGRTARGKPVPIYQRSTYFESLSDYNCVTCFDPTLFHDSELSIAWFQGDKSKVYALELAELWQKFVDKVKIDPSNILYFGSSAGGIPGFHLAKKTPGSTLYMSNVQTDIRSYYSGFVRALADVAFAGDMNYLKSASLTQNRFTINGQSGPFHLVYAQNKADTFHYDNHYTKWRELTSLDGFSSATFIEYNDPETGHSPLGFQAEIETIRGIVEKRPFFHIFPNAEVTFHEGNIAPLAPLSHIMLRHRAFKARKLRFPIKWTQDPYKSRDWRHHLNSLHWVATFAAPVKAAIVEDFYQFHRIKKKKNKYFNQQLGMRTIAVRIRALLDLREEFLANQSLLATIDSLIQADVESLLNDKVYRSNSHGLMADLSVLRAIDSAVELRPELSDFVFTRLLHTLTQVYDDDGVCLEHSISRQESNLAILTEIQRRLQASTEAYQFIEKILTTSKRLLGFHLLPSQQYIPFGDSLRLPNQNILKSVYGEEEPHRALAPYANIEGIYFSKSGFFAACDLAAETHIALVSGWHSDSHKQNDELSLFVCYKGLHLFDDPGYSDYRSNDELTALKSEQWHSNVWVENCEWSDVKTKPHSSNLSLRSENPIQIIASSARQEGIKITRELTIEHPKLYICDTIHTTDTEELTVRHQFLLTDVYAEVNADRLCLHAKSDQSLIAEITVDADGEWVFTSAQRVAADPRLIEEATLLVFRSPAPQVNFIVTLL